MTMFVLSLVYDTLTTISTETNFEINIRDSELDTSEYFCKSLYDNINNSGF